MEASLPDSVALAKKTVAELFEQETTWTEKKVFDLKISIPPHSGKSAGLGIDTTRLYKQLPPEKQYGHTVQMVPMQPTNSRYGYSDTKRAGRQQDVVVTGISEITKKRWRADIKDNVIVLSINKAPISVRRKQKDQLLKDLDTLLKMVSSSPDVELPA